jgi:hypothetical protein
MTAAKTEPRRGRWRALFAVLAVAACVPFNGCNLNPRPEHSSALGGDPEIIGSGGVTGSPIPGAGGVDVSGAGGAGASAPGSAQDGGAAIDRNPDGGADAIDGSLVDGATGEGTPDGPT